MGFKAKASRSPFYQLPPIVILHTAAWCASAPVPLMVRYPVFVAGSRIHVTSHGHDGPGPHGRGFVVSGVRSGPAQRRVHPRQISEISCRAGGR